MADSLTEDEGKVARDEMEVVWCTALRQAAGGGDRDQRQSDEWDFAWKRSLDPEWRLQRSRILSAMACSRDSRRLKRLLSRVFHPTIDQSAGESLALLGAMAAGAENPIGRSLALRFITTNFKSLNEL